VLSDDTQATLVNFFDCAECYSKDSRTHSSISTFTVICEHMRHVLVLLESGSIAPVPSDAKISDSTGFFL
jgi:hypothetical protein